MSGHAVGAGIVSGRVGWHSQLPPPQIFRLSTGILPVERIDLNSGWNEPGENTFMREPLVWQVGAGV